MISSKDKTIIVAQITEVKDHLSNAQEDLLHENFEEASDEVLAAINASTCGKCQRKMKSTSQGILYTQSVCNIGGNTCGDLKYQINNEIEDFKENYLPRVEEVLSARES